jgi:tetratricopeptide (TPR) repeat protein
MPVRRLTAAEAYEALKSNPYNEWPRRDDLDNRFAHFADPAFSPGFLLEPGQRIFTIGSCFARNIERALESAGFEVPTLSLKFDMPRWTGTAIDALNNYVPPTIAPQIRWAFGLQAFDFDKHCLEFGRGRYLDLQMPFIMKAMPEAVVRDNRERISAVYRQLATTDVVLITLGLIEAWYDHRAESYITCTPPKRVVSEQPGRFELHVLEYNEVLAAMRDLLGLLDQVCPAGHRVILTVSPVPLNATFTSNDVSVANTYSKAVLRSVVEVVVAERPNVEYFPSYESVTLTDRSLAYVDDQVHIDGALVAFNVERMLRRYVRSDAVETPAAVVARAKEERARGRLGVALKTLQAGWRKYPGDAELVVALADASRRAGKTDFMEKLLLDFLEKRDDPNARLQLATYYNDVGRHEEAARQCEQGLLLKKGRLMLSIQRAIACYHLGRFKEGLAVLERQKYTWERESIIVFWQARCQEGLQNVSEAEACYRRCMDISEDVAYMTAFAAFLKAQGKGDEAREWLKRALALSPFDGAALKLKLSLSLPAVSPGAAPRTPAQSLLHRLLSTVRRRDAEAASAGPRTVNPSPAPADRP